MLRSRKRSARRLILLKNYAHEQAEEFYFNSFFPILFQEALFKLSEHSTFVNISSTRIFKNSTDKYSLSKKNSEKIMFNKGKIVSIYPSSNSIWE